MAQPTNSVSLDKTTTFTSPNGWYIVTSLKLKEGDTKIKKSTDFTNLNELPDDIRQLITDGKLTIEVS
tara:strand:- start:1824 stop:2027 length:204 start_codon:yes stop_codon:yes gene_type:complete